MEPLGKTWVIDFIRDKLGVYDVDELEGVLLGVIM